MSRGRLNLDYRGPTADRCESPHFGSPWNAWAQIFALAIVFTVVAIVLLTALLTLLSSAFSAGLVR